ncbi:hypothetical protein D9758_012160 [Tetrapyrgos nigripes]|uniref:D-xylose 1-dehydrogenase (NADP(+), D-xylono-1,5-lactone-forming) n=1 Tax=Tetrapyrgos nigripes TaxID=182062 RepID=A0A8H5CGA0_9AGAR|nr:hypothetical protein D9758_012160 [Tetrapyrgos nigripes]
MLAFISRVQKIANPPSSAVQPKEKTALKFGCLDAANIVPGALVIPAKSHPDAKAYGGAIGYQDMINDPEVDVIYNPLPNGLHFEWTMKALKGGKHVLLEKPAANTEDEARQIFTLAEKKGLVVLEASYYRFPSIQRVKAILDSKELGPTKTITAALSAPEGTSKPDDIRWKYELGGGSMMDPGSYTVNVLNYLASPNKPKSVLTASAEPYSSATEHKQIDKNYFWNDSSFPKLKATVRCEGGSIEIFNFLMPHYYHYITVSPKGKRSRTEKAYKFGDGSKGEDWCISLSTGGITRSPRNSTT